MAERWKIFAAPPYIERCGIAIGVVALRERTRLFALRAAGDEGDQLEQGVRRGRERDFVGQDFTKRPPAHLRRVRGAKQRDDLIDMAELVAGENAKVSPTS